MKKNLLLVLLAATSFFAHSQTKGTNALGFGITSHRNETEWKANEYNNGHVDKQSQNSFSLTYGRFIKDNIRLGVTGSVSRGEQEDSNSTYKTEGSGIAINYQQYYPLLKRFYAFAGGRASTFHQDIENSGLSSLSGDSQQYGIGANGGVACFISKRFAFEAQLLSADFTYFKSKNAGDQINSRQSFFNVSTTGFINNLGFHIYFLF